MKGGLNLGDASYKLVQLDMQHAHREWEVHRKFQLEDLKESDHLGN